jgi:hypothetical protein
LSLPHSDRLARHLSPLTRRALWGVLCLLAAGAAWVWLVPSFFGANAAQGQNSPDGLWQDVEERTLAATVPRSIIPQKYRTLRLNQTALDALLRQAPMESSATAKSARVELTLPLPNGKFARFQIEESPIMEPGLAAKFPEIKTYRGQGLDDRAALLRFDQTPLGFHAQVLSEQGTIYIDPYAPGDTANYISYYKLDHTQTDPNWHCLVTGANRRNIASSRSNAPELVVGTVLRTYRLALAVTGEYTAFFGGTVGGAMSAMVTTMNRVNGIYTRDLAARIVLVANNNQLIYTNANTDPYTNDSPFGLLIENQANLDTVIGSNNYDIGHVFSTDPGGLAYIGVICDSFYKAQGESGLSSPTGDGFDVDYVAHELGHQFGASHSYNGLTSNCAGSRETFSAYEVGSGSTIMAYAGICGAQNLQLNSDDLFHRKSLDEILSYLNTTACNTFSATGNLPPAVNAGSIYTIPRSTPFTLTAYGSDPNGDALTYAWEQYDIGPASPPDSDADGVARPIFRSYQVGASPSRTFPKWQYILNNANVPPTSYNCGGLTCLTGEILPAITRVLNFEITVRDNHASGGGMTTAYTQVSVKGNAGPFTIASPNSAVNWVAGSNQTVTWNVAGTSALPIGATSVRLLLSTDGGNTFPFVLNSNTPNDGAELVTLPNLPTAQARIKVEALGNIFFDVSDVNFTISASGCVYYLAPAVQTYPATAGSGSFQVLTQAGCGWNASTSTSWLTINSGSGSGNGMVSFSLMANGSASSRNGTISVGGQNFTVKQGAQFLDVPNGAPFYNEIGKFSAAGITLGCGGGDYCPNANVTREQMAAFIIRALGEFNPPTPNSQRFIDVPPTNPFYNFIDRMAVLQITLGCTASAYCPTGSVTREQMAAFIIRALGIQNPATPTVQRFIDVPTTSGFYKFIEELALRQITQGCSSYNYCPAQNVTRAQMAVFLVRAFNL